jgi:hypothetical protein
MRHRSHRNRTAAAHQRMHAHRDPMTGQVVRDDHGHVVMVPTALIRVRSLCSVGAKPGSRDGAQMTRKKNRKARAKGFASFVHLVRHYAARLVGR